MNRNFDFLRQVRNNQIKIIKAHSLDQLNAIPTGLNNNLIWNFAHCVVTQQLLHYRLSGNDVLVTEDMIEGYRKGSKPSGSVDQSFVDYTLEKAVSTVDQLISDHEQGLFKDYKEYPTSFGTTMRSIDDAVIFNNMHEAMHYGTMLTIRNLLK